MKKYFMLLVGVVFLSATLAHAVPVTFFGEDLGQGESVRLSSHPNADAARANFFSNLTGVGTEDFESFANGTGTPLAVNFGSAGTATLKGTGSVSKVTSGTNGVGRYPISGDNYWETSSNLFYLEFTAPVAAFGFYGIDIGDFNGQITLTYENGVANTLSLPHTVGGTGGSVVYYGFYDVANLFTKVTFGNSGSGADYFGFDDFSIGSKGQVTSVPEPATLFLLGIGVLGMISLKKEETV